MNCSNSSECHWPLGKCVNIQHTSLGSFNLNFTTQQCLCCPGLYSLYSTGSDCRYASSPGSLSLQILFLLPHFVVLGFCIYKLHCLSSYVLGVFALPKLLCWIWIVYTSAMSTLLLTLTSRTLSGASLNLCCQILMVIMAPTILGPMLYSAWFTTFAFQMVRQTTHRQRNLIIKIFHALVGFFTIIIFISSLLFAISE